MPDPTDKPSRNEDEYFAKANRELLEKKKAALASEQRAAERKSHHMKCPKCGADLTPEDMHGVQIDRCGECGGLWLDAGEIDALMQHEDHGALGRIVRDLLTGFRGRS